MGKTALFAIAAFAVMGAVYGLSTSGGMLGTSEEIAEHDYEIMARNAAISGYEQAKLKLSETFASETFSGSYEGAAYTVSAQVTGGEAKVTSLGQAFLPSGSTKLFHVVATFRQESSYTIADEPPAFMQYALITEDDLKLAGNLDIERLDTEGAAESNLNADVHTNGSLTVNGKAANIRGFGSYKTFENVRHESVFRPYYNPANDPVVYRIAEGIDIPAVEFDIPTLVASLGSAVDQTSTEDVTLSGTYDFEAMGATRNNPHIWHITGNLSGSGNVELQGYVMFLVDGNASFSGNLQQDTAGERMENSTAIYVSGDVSISGTADFLNAQIFAKEDVQMTGTSGIYGTVAVGGEAKIAGTPLITYVPASPALTTIWQDPETRLKLLTYREY